MTITVVTPTIPARANMLKRAMFSVRVQTLQPDETIIWTDQEGIGACNARNKAFEHVTTDFVAFLDDDDELLPHHLQALHETQEETNADLVYSQYQGINTHLFAHFYGRPFDEQLRQTILTVQNFIPITCLIRTKALRDVAGFSPPPGFTNDNPCEDWGAWIKMLNNGATFAHYAGVTWQWNGHAGHTSGRKWTEIYGANRE